MNDAEIIEAIGKLGKNQKMCFGSLCEHGRWPGGWEWAGYAGTERMMKAFVKRGLATYDPADRRFKPIPEVLSFHNRTLALVRARVAADCARYEADRLEEERRSGKRWKDLRDVIKGRIFRLGELAEADGVLGDPDVEAALGALLIARDALGRVRGRVRAMALKADETEKS